MGLANGRDIEDTFEKQNKKNKWLLLFSILKSPVFTLRRAKLRGRNSVQK